MPPAEHPGPRRYATRPPPLRLPYNRRHVTEGMADRVSKWSDDGFLDGLRQAGDPPADAAVARLKLAGGDRAVGRAFQHLQGNATPIPPDAPPALHDFIEAAGALPAGVDTARLAAGAAAFLQNALPSVVVLLRLEPAPRLRGALSDRDPVDLGGPESASVRPPDGRGAAAGQRVGRRRLRPRRAGHHQARNCGCCTPASASYRSVPARLPCPLRRAGQPRGHARDDHGVLLPRRRRHRPPRAAAITPGCRGLLLPMARLRAADGHPPARSAGGRQA